MLSDDCPALVPDLDRITRILSQELDDSTQRRQSCRDTPAAFVCEDFRTSPWSANTIQYWTLQKRESLVLSQCKRYFEAAESPGGYLKSLDESFAALVTTTFVLEEGQTLEGVAEGTFDYLSRLPATPQYLPEVRIEGVSSTVSQQVLETSSFLNTNIIRMALAWIIYKGGISHTFSTLTDQTAEQLEIASNLANECSSDAERKTWLLVRAFLWSSWQRSLMIYFHANVGIQLTRFHHERNNYLLMRDTFPSPNLPLQTFSDQTALKGRSPYMCTWAFELMRTEPACMVADFRLFHWRFSQLFGSQQARCNIQSALPCDGRHSDNCQRFKGMKIKDQSTHDANCSGYCPRLIWDERSYRSVQGARAVSLADTDTSQHRVRYCLATEKTVAISHVWSHGQGGRPEEGMNQCLHERYKRIARSFDCDSYWMDTPCIPKDHQLRKEAIQSINVVFYQSALTLVCDRDLMSMDVTNIETQSVELLECILAAVLVCDWNVRAWTFLESMKGRNNVRILCKNDTTLSVREIMNRVYAEGRIEIGILCHLLSNFLPRVGDGHEKTPMDRFLRSDDILNEISGTLLSYRPASRPGDDIVIWSLLLGGDQIFYDPVDFWRSRIGTSIFTGFLISSAGRCKGKGLSWAPASPYAAPRTQARKKQRYFYRAFDGIDTELARVEEEGIFGPWFICELDDEDEGAIKPKTGDIANEIRKIRRSFLWMCRFGALLQPVGTSQSIWRKSQTAARYRGRVDGTLLVVVGCNKWSLAEWRGHRVHKWRWKGIYAWPRDVPLPAFKKDYPICIA
jgi:hypothetical protein